MPTTDIELKSPQCDLLTSAFRLEKRLEARKAARTSPPQVAMASSTSASTRAAVSASDFIDRCKAFTSGHHLRRSLARRALPLWRRAGGLAPLSVASDVALGGRAPPCLLAP